MKEFSETIKVKCETCGGTIFEFDDTKYSSLAEAEEVKCIKCNREYTGDELSKVCRKQADYVVEEISDELMKNAVKKIDASIKKMNRKMRR